MDSTSAKRYYSYNSVIQKRKIREAVLRIKRAIRQRKFREEQSRQRVMLSLLLCCCAVSLFMPTRAVWVRDRSRVWWDHIVGATFTPDDWLTNFRMSRNTFLYLCNELKAELVRSDTIMRKAISVEKRVAVTLWYLASNADFRTIGHLFGFSKASVSHIRTDVCKAIVKLLLPKYITFPNGTRLQYVMAGFLSRGFPQCAGAIDGTHIPVAAPAENASDYYNRKGWHSVILQGTVDHEGLFTDIYTGWPGRVHDARVFSNSGLYSKAESGSLLPNCAQSLSGVSVPCFLVGDPAYPLRPWLMKPFINTGCLTPQQQCFNNRLSKSRVVVEYAFGRLKGRWRCQR